jgi:ParB family chromosome partitioning protein
LASKLSGIELTRYDDLFKTDAEREADRQERIQIVPAAEVFPYSRQPYTIDRPTPDLVRLMDSIEHIGIAEPLIVRPRDAGGYEIISGHRRDYCAKAVGLDTRPVIVRNYSDEEADILVVDYNINREDLLPSEKAKAYKLKLDAMKRQGQKRVGTSPQNGEKLKENYSVSILGEQVKESATQIQRYVRLNLLIPPLVEAVDKGFLKLAPAADFLSHLSEKEQTYLLLVMERDEVSPSLGQAQRLKQLSGEGKLENNIIDLIMREEKPLERKVTIRNDRLQKYFPSSYTPKQMEDVIIKLLEGWHRKRQQEQAR